MANGWKTYSNRINHRLQSVCYPSDILLWSDPPAILLPSSVLGFHLREFLYHCAISLSVILVRESTRHLWWTIGARWADLCNRRADKVNYRVEDASHLKKRPKQNIYFSSLVSELETWTSTAGCSAQLVGNLFTWGVHEQRLHSVDSAVMPISSVCKSVGFGSYYMRTASSSNAAVDTCRKFNASLTIFDEEKAVSSFCQEMTPTLRKGRRLKV